MKAKLVSENVRFERGQDPKSSMGIGKRSSYALDLKKGDPIDVFSNKEDRYVLVEVIEDTPVQKWTMFDGGYLSYLSTRVKVLDPDYKSHKNQFFGEDYEMIRTFPDDFNWWELVE